MSGAIIAAFIALFGNVLASALGVKSDYDTRKQSRENAERQIEAEKELMNLQAENQEKLNQSARDYNDPVKQVELRRKAGLSPYTMDSGGYTAVATSGSAASGSAQKADTVPSSLPAMLSSLLSSTMSAASLPSEIDLNQKRSANIDKDTANKSLDSILKKDEHALNSLRFLAGREDINNKRLMNAALELENIYASDTLQARVQSKLFEGKSAALNYQIMMKELEAKDFYVSHLQPLEYDKMLADINHVTAMTAVEIANEEAVRHGISLTDAQVVSTYRMAELYSTMNEGKALDNQFSRDTWDDRKSQINWQAKQTKRDYKWTPVKNVTQGFRDVAVGVGSVVGSFLGIKGLGAKVAGDMGLGHGIPSGHQWNSRGFAVHGTSPSGLIY